MCAERALPQRICTPLLGLVHLLKEYGVESACVCVGGGSALLRATPVNASAW